MKPQLMLFCIGAMACLLPIGCSHYPESREQRPVYSFENVDIGPADSGQQYRQEATGTREPDRRLR